MDNKWLERKVIVSLQIKPKTAWQLLEDLDCSAKQLAEAIIHLLKKELIREKKGILSSSIQPKWDPIVFKHFSCKPKQFFDSNNALFKRFRIFGKGFIPQELHLNQQRVNDIDLFNKLSVMTLKKDIADASIAVLGDDDLFSLALALTGLPKKITVFEIDKKILEYIGKIAQREGFEIDLVQHDISKPLPQKYVEKFDGFVTEQPEARIGLYSFLRFGTKALKPNGWGYFSLTCVENSWSKWRQLQADLSQNGFAITSLIEQFSTYLDDDLEEDYDNLRFVRALPFKPANEQQRVYTAALVRIQSTGNHTPLRVPKPRKGESFFVDEETVVEEAIPFNASK
ncbi:bis-aminopropyl spermidine synthase family protein [Candidatus Micrarchaeota archaeon]|nr:bis-aminopropyl spermidine synthase family protein [Candidatus Micrarchaeota archaeon]MBU1930549.1 bis-aminopropyl spermidine synthase family protein [Candidatus Micrarchaeota archaeon]